MKWIAWVLVGAALGFGGAFLAQRALETASGAPPELASAMAGDTRLPASPAVGGAQRVLPHPRAAAVEPADGAAGRISAPLAARSTGGAVEREPTRVRSATPPPRELRSAPLPREPRSTTPPRESRSKPPPPRAVTVGSLPGPFVAGGGEVAGVGDVAAQPPLREGAQPESLPTTPGESAEPETRGTTPDEPVEPDPTQTEPTDPEPAERRFTRACGDEGSSCISNSECCSGLVCFGAIPGYGTRGSCR